MRFLVIYAQKSTLNAHDDISREATYRSKFLPQSSSTFILCVCKPLWPWQDWADAQTLRL